MMPTVSYVVPCYNKEKYLEECLNSILAQDYPDIKIVLVDDGSTDGSFEIAKSLLIGGHQIFSLEQNRGLGNALRLGYRYAKGEYICFLSADDVLTDPDKTDRQVGVMEFSKGIDMTFYNQFSIGESVDKITDKVEVPMWYNRILENNNLAAIVLLEQEFIGSASLMHRKHSYFRLGEWNPNLRNVNDHDLNLKHILYGAKIRMIEGNPVLYRKNPDQLSNDPDFTEKVNSVNNYWKSEILRGNYSLILKAWVRSLCP